MAKIVTFTINPSIDLSTSVEEVVATQKLRCASELREAGGGGINVTRAIKRLGGDAHALYTAGGVTGQLLRGLVEREGLDGRAIEIAGDTRENFTIQESDTSRQYRFVLPGPRLDRGEWRQCLEVLNSLSPPPMFLVASGSLPLGVPDDIFAQAARIARRIGTKLVLDTSGAALKAALEEPIYLIKPNLRELQSISDGPLDSAKAQIDAARQLVNTNRVEVVTLTLGTEGGVLVTKDLILTGRAPPVRQVSSVGAGDSFLGGLVHKLTGGSDYTDAFRYALAAGTAALLTPGTELCREEDVERLYKDVIVSTLASD